MNEYELTPIRLWPPSLSLLLNRTPDLSLDYFANCPPLVNCQVLKRLIEAHCPKASHFWENSSFLSLNKPYRFKFIEGMVDAGARRL